MRYINLHFTYLLTYLLTERDRDKEECSLTMMGDVKLVGVHVREITDPAQSKPLATGNLLRSSVSAAESTGCIYACNQLVALDYSDC